MRAHVHTVTEADVGRGSQEGVRGHPCCFAPLGRVLPIDVGKRIYLVAAGSTTIDGHTYRVRGVYQVESNEQRDRRLGL